MISTRGRVHNIGSEGSRLGSTYYIEVFSRIVLQVSSHDFPAHTWDRLSDEDDPESENVKDIHSMHDRWTHGPLSREASRHEKSRDVDCRSGFSAEWPLRGRTQAGPRQASHCDRISSSDAVAGQHRSDNAYLSTDRPR